MKSIVLLIATSLIALTAVAEELKPGAWVPLPAVGSSPETGFQYGAYVMRIFPQTKANVPQNRLELLLQGTANGQFQSYIWPNIYVADGKLQLKGKLGGKYWPSEYFGTGNDTPESGDKFADTAFESSVTANMKLTDTASVGVSAFGEYHEIEDIDEDVLSNLLDATIVGADGGWYSGVGINARYDTRNNLDWPTAGQSVAVGTNVFTSILGSDETFLTALLRGTHHQPIGKNVVSASAQYQYASEDTPFTHLPRPSGSYSLRGANGNRWIDYQALGAQAEYRATITQRWAVVGFADSYQVAPTIGDFALDDFHVTLGAGLRFAMTPDRFNIRIDFGYVDLESFGYVINVGEAF